MTGETVHITRQSDVDIYLSLYLTSYKTMTDTKSASQWYGFNDDDDAMRCEINFDLNSAKT